MRDVRFEVSKLFQLAFGINSPIFITEPLLKNTPATISYSDIQTLPEYEDSNATSWMGTPILFGVKLVGGKYKRYQGSGKLEEVEMRDLTLPPATMFSFRRAKNITRTNVLGSNGTVKEIFGFDDWIIDVKGLCLDEPNRSAKEQLDQLLLWEKLADAIEVSGSLFSRVDLKRICISEFSYEIPQGSPGTIAFQMQFYGDQALEFFYTT